MNRILRTLVFLASMAGLSSSGQYMTAGDGSDTFQYQFVMDRNYSGIQGEFESGGAFEGFRHARVDEAFFIFQAFYGYSMAGSEADNFNPVFDILQDMSVSPYVSGGETAANATNWLNVDGGGTFTFQISRDVSGESSAPLSGNIDYSNLSFMSFSRTATQPTIGQFIIRYDTLATPVPEPAQIVVLLLVGLGGMLIVRRRLQKRSR